MTAATPPIGNTTFSLWHTEDDMLRFAYGEQHGGHHDTVRANRRSPILAEQLNARLRAVRISGTWDPETTLHAARLAQLARALDPAGVPG